MGLSVTPGNENFRHEALQSLDPIGFTFKVLLDLPFLSSKGPVQIVWALEIGCVQMRVVILHPGETRSLVYEKPPFQANTWRHRYDEHCSKHCMGDGGNMNTPEANTYPKSNARNCDLYVLALLIGDLGVRKSSRP